MCKLFLTHLKMKLLTNYTLTNHMYIHLTVYKQTINSKSNYLYLIEILETI